MTLIKILSIKNVGRFRNSLASGNVTFNPTLESGLRTNVVGTQNVIAFTKRMKRPCLIHISTCFVAGNRSGAVWENEDVIGYFPRKNELKGVEFSVEQEIKDCAKMSERAREEAKDAMRVAHFREQARKRLQAVFEARRRRSGRIGSGCGA